ncbi:M3 family oligoendopeptidase [Mycoplasmopsis lipophila]|uniref:M3 family oligoendopeptidase n=1 Tax=Mycoplasmopsis lipophila TaxID=2117 RepID=UPI0038733060
MKVKQFKKYEEVPEQYRFDLENILEGKNIDDLINEYKNLYEIMIQNKFSKYETIEKYLEDIEINKKITIISNRISNYLSNKHNANLIDPEILALIQKFELIDNELSIRYGSDINRFYQNIEKIKIWKEDPRLKTYKIQIENNIKEYEHKLDDKVEEYLIESAIGVPDLESIFEIITDSEMDYGFPLDSKKKKHPLNRANRISLMKSNDKVLRKNVRHNWIKAIYDHRESLAQILYQHFNYLVTIAKTRKYPSTVEMLTKEDEVSKELLQKLFNNVSKQKIIFKKFNQYYKVFYSKKYKEKYDEKTDAYRDLTKIKSSYTIEEMQNIVIEALKPYGQEYSEKIKEAINNRWIDYMSVDHKQSGAYSIGESYGLNKKYILMNFDGDLRSVETLAHELGHSMHSYFSDKNQPIENSQYPIFLAEIASIYNELMLYDYLLKTSKDDHFKFKILTSMIEGFMGTVMRQVEWANYEFDLYKAIEKGEPASSYDAISKIYFENAKKYSNKKIIYKPFELIASIDVPHYYYHFYVYKYAIGQLSANYFFMKYKENDNFLQEYIHNFLSAGCSQKPLDILKNNGIDLNDETYYENGFKFVDELINQWINLGKKIFKIK